MTNIKYFDKKLDPQISLVKVVAMLIIIQSHSDKLFPAEISFLATGGALGNELFFLVGGYLYSTKKGILQTTWKRFLRLYIPVYIMEFAQFMLGTASMSDIDGIKSFIYYVIWPTPFWFVSAFFAMGWLFHVMYNIKLIGEKKKSQRFIAILISVDIILYLLYVTPKEKWIVEDVTLLGGMFHFKCIYSFAVFCIGNWIKQMANEKTNTEKNTIFFIGSVVSFVAFYGFKVLLKFGIVPMVLQVISQFLTIICVLFLFLWILNSNIIRTIFQKSLKLSDIVNKLGGITLEAFLVQFEIIRLISKLDVSFPVNYILTVIIVIVVACIFQSLNQKIYTLLIRERNV